MYCGVNCRPLVGSLQGDTEAGGASLTEIFTTVNNLLGETPPSATSLDSCHGTMADDI